jgi:hypothetical protein
MMISRTETVLNDRSLLYQQFLNSPESKDDIGAALPYFGNMDKYRVAKATL